jgi:hypothetical protein
MHKRATITITDRGMTITVEEARTLLGEKPVIHHDNI